MVQGEERVGCTRGPSRVTRAGLNRAAPSPPPPISYALTPRLPSPAWLAGQAPRSSSLGRAQEGARAEVSPQQLASKRETAHHAVLSFTKAKLQLQQKQTPPPPFATHRTSCA